MQKFASVQFSKSEKPIVSVVVIGHIDAGKSTLVGQECFSFWICCNLKNKIRDYVRYSGIMLEPVWHVIVFNYNYI